MNKRCTYYASMTGMINNSQIHFDPPCVYGKIMMGFALVSCLLYMYIVACIKTASVGV